MPELPEVETIRRSLTDLIVGKTIESAQITYPKLLKNASPEKFERDLPGRTIAAVKRRGKYLLIEFQDDYVMIIHLRMTGQLRYEKPETPLRKHTHFVLQLSDGHQLRFVDTRKFGMIFIGSREQAEHDAGLHRLGPEPLSDDFSVEYLTEVLQGTARKVKSVLLDQQKIAGLGNIYVDESLFRAGIHPESTACCLPPEKVRQLHHSIRQVLRDGIEHRGTTLNDYVDGFGRQGEFQFQLNVYGRKEKPCPVCGAAILKCRVMQRGTHLCPVCQVKYQ